MPFSIDYVRKYLNENFRFVQERESSTDSARFAVPFRSYLLVFIVDNKRDYIGCRVSNMIVVKQKHQAAVLKYAMDRNFRMVLGKFSFDPDDGEMAFVLNHATEGLEGPWDRYDEILRRIIGVTLSVADEELEKLQELNFTGQIPGDGDEKKEEGTNRKGPDYDSVVKPVLDGNIQADSIPPGLRRDLARLIIKLAIESGRNKIEDFPEPWQRFLKEFGGSDSGSDSGSTSGAGSGSEI